MRRKFCCEGRAVFLHVKSKAPARSDRTGAPHAKMVTRASRCANGAFLVLFGVVGVACGGRASLSLRVVYMRQRISSHYRLIGQWVRVSVLGGRLQVHDPSLLPKRHPEPWYPPASIDFIW
jgi:hypothetical protein